MKRLSMKGLPKKGLSMKGRSVKGFSLCLAVLSFLSCPALAFQASGQNAPQANPAMLNDVTSTDIDKIEAEIRAEEKSEIEYKNRPADVNGQLSVCGTQLCNQFGLPVQLRGMSTHGLQWYGWNKCVTPSALDNLANDWEADIIRVALYVQEGGYETDPDFFTEQVGRIIDEVSARGMYVIVDWHMLSPGDPNLNLSSAKTFFKTIANEHQNKRNIIYEIANEPNGVSWKRIKRYADKMIKHIRKYDAKAPIIVGTQGWSSLGISEGRSLQDILDNPVRAENILYSFHFYAASHGDTYFHALRRAAERLPIFVTEWGSQTYSGDGDNDFAMAQRYLDLMAEKNIGWTYWNYSDDKRSGAAWKQGTCRRQDWSEKNLKSAGKWVQERMQVPEVN